MGNAKTSVNGWRDWIDTYHDLKGIGFTDDETQAMFQFVKRHDDITIGRVKLEYRVTDAMFQITIKI